MNTIATKTQLPVQQIVQWCGIARGKFYDWRKRYGKVNEHNGLVPRDHWIEEWERQSVIDYFDCHPLDGYRRLTFMMLDEDVVAVSPSTNPKPSRASFSRCERSAEPGWEILVGASRAVSTRNYESSLDKPSAKLKSRGTSKSAASRHLVSQTTKKL